MRLLPQEVPRDPIHAEILHGLVSKRLTPGQVMPLFDIPGIGFHRALWILTLSMAYYKWTGSNTFVVPGAMRKALEQTSLEEVTADDLKLPFPCVYIALPGCDLELWGGPRTQWHECGGVFLVRPTPEVGICDEDQDLITVYLWGMENDRSDAPGDDASFWLTIDLNEMRRMNLDLEQYLYMLLADESRDETSNDLLPLGLRLELGTEMPKGKRRTKLVNSMVSILRIAINTLVYLDTDEPDVTPDKDSAKVQAQRQEAQKALDRIKNPNKSRGRRLRKKLEELPEDRIVWVGGSLTSTEPSGRKGSTGERRKAAEHWVRGHWRPKRRTIKAKMEMAKTLSETQTEAAFKAMERATSLKSGAASKITKALKEAQRAQEEAVEATADYTALQEELEGRRRWIRPYQRNKGAERKVKSHLYVVGD